jgi:hypothetical protein
MHHGVPATDASSPAGSPIRRETPKSITLTRGQVPHVDEEHVLRLDVAVHDAGLVERRERGGDLRGDRHDLRGRQRPAIGDRGERVAGEVLHHEVRQPIGRGPRVADLEEAGVLRRRGEPVLGEQALLDLVVVGKLRIEHLERDPLAGVDVRRQVDPAHAAARQR